MAKQTVQLNTINLPVEILQTPGPANFQIQVRQVDMQPGDVVLIRGYLKSSELQNPPYYFATMELPYDGFLDQMDSEGLGVNISDSMFDPYPKCVEAGEFIGIELNMLAATVPMPGDPFTRDFECWVTNIETKA